MKKRIGFAWLFLTGMIGLSAQQDMTEMGLALRYEDSVGGYYATHRTHPFGTKLLITNLMNDNQLEVQVGGRPDSNSKALVEISALACDFLGIGHGVLTQVLVEVEAKSSQPVAMRSRLSVEQTGRAFVHDSVGEELEAYHPSIALNTSIIMTNTANGKSAIVVVKGRVPASKDRIVEISSAVARALSIRGSGEVHLKTQ